MEKNEKAVKKELVEVQVDIPDDLYEKLEKEAASRDMTVDDYASALLTQWFTDCERVAKSMDIDVMEVLEAYFRDVTEEPDDEDKDKDKD